MSSEVEAQDSPVGRVDAAVVRKLAEEAAARFLRYVPIDTQSDPSSNSYPSTHKQYDLLHLLVQELGDIGMRDVEIDHFGYVTATLPATVESVPVIAFFAHVDTTPDVSGRSVRPLRRRYEGGDILLGYSGQVITPAEAPELAKHVGHEVITSDGTTLLGADNKAGIAEIMAGLAYLARTPSVAHGTVKVAFTPDEEIARGVDHFPVDSFGAVAGYTLDGMTAGEMHDETFSAGHMIIRFRGRSIHPGWAKDELVNAIKLASAFVDSLPKDRLSPETTEGRDGYVHPLAIDGDAGTATIRLLVRDFDEGLLQAHVEMLRRTARDVAARDRRSSVEFEWLPQYGNIREVLRDQPDIVANLEAAIVRVGLVPQKVPFRGGTDGARLTALGLPTPNIFTGCQNAHSEREWICVEDMGLAAAVVAELARIWAEP